MRFFSRASLLVAACSITLTISKPIQDVTTYNLTDVAQECASAPYLNSNITTDLNGERRKFKIIRCNYEPRKQIYINRYNCMDAMSGFPNGSGLTRFKQNDNDNKGALPKSSEVADCSIRVDLFNASQGSRASWMNIRYDICDIISTCAMGRPNWSTVGGWTSGGENDNLNISVHRTRPYTPQVGVLQDGEAAQYR